MQVSTVGLDLAKNIFRSTVLMIMARLHSNRALRRAQALAFFERLEPCLVGIEACGTSHHWARELIKLGQNVKRIPPAYVKPYVTRGKSDAVDAAAICEAVTRPTMRFVEVKTPEQQAILSVHRTRDLIVRQRTQTINMLRAQLAEFGIILPQGVYHPLRFARDCENEGPLDLPSDAREVVIDLCDQLLFLHVKILRLARQMTQIAKTRNALHCCERYPLSLIALQSTAGQRASDRSQRRQLLLRSAAVNSSTTVESLPLGSA